MLKGKKILLGVTASISAYKAAYLLRLLINAGAEVKVLMTPLAKDFITPLTMATLSNNPVMSDFYEADTGEWNNHVELGAWADVFLVAPATANTMAKMASGIADNLLLTCFLSAKCPVLVAPAMDLDMYKHPANKKNIRELKKLGVGIIEPQSGELASGLKGKGRLEEPEKILEKIKTHFDARLSLYNKSFIVTAGPTYEKLDPVRFIGNYSSGKMGFAIAEKLADKGADVILITGPTSLKAYNDSIELIKITSANEMYNACLSFFPNCDGAIMSAAVADFSPVHQNRDKVKRSGDRYTLELQPTKDIAASLGEMKQKHQILVGFALETHNEEDNAIKKIKKKNLDFIVLNSLKDKGAGFNYDTNKITILDAKGDVQKYKLKPKNEVAEDIVERIVDLAIPEKK